MRKLVTLLMLAMLGMATWSCSYDDDDLWAEIEGQRIFLVGKLSFKRIA